MQGREKTQNNGGSARHSQARKQSAKNASANPLLVALGEEEPFEEKKHQTCSRRSKA